MWVCGYVDMCVWDVVIEEVCLFVFYEEEGRGRRDERGGGGGGERGCLDV
jgi:hypothetical protein